MAFPHNRMRRLRKTGTLRRMLAETKVSVDDLIYPMFVVPGSKVKKEIGAMPGSHHWSVDLVAEEAKKVEDVGIPAVILFGIPESKD